MVTLSQFSLVLHHGLLLFESYDSVSVPHQALNEQYNIINFLGGTAPYKQHRGFGIPPVPPPTCEVDHVQLVSRHGERFPSLGDGKAFEEIMDVVTHYKQNQPFKGDLEFFNNYKYFVKDKEYYEKETKESNAPGLPYLGFDDAMRHGKVFRERYGKLVTKKFPVFSLNSRRCYNTGREFAKGLLGDKFDDAEFVVVSEDAKMGGNSLTPRYACRNAEWDQLPVDKYDQSYLDRVVERWQVDNPGFNLTGGQVSRMMLWCGFEINVRGWSPLCDLFTPEEYIREQYRGDLVNYYLFGRGNRKAKAIGSPMLRASVKLLRDFDSEHKVFVSFTHDTDLELMLSSLGIVDPADHLPTSHIPFPNPYSAAEIVPMGARLYVERLKCGDARFVRFVLNDAVIPISACQNGPGFSCPLDDFVNYVDDQLKDVDYGKDCDVEGPRELSFYWDYTKVKYDAPLINQ